MDQSSPQEPLRVTDDQAASLREMTPGEAARRVGHELALGAPAGLVLWRSAPALLIVGWAVGAADALLIVSAAGDSNVGPGKPLFLGCLAVLLLGCFLMILAGTRRRVLRGWLARYPHGYAQMLAGDPAPRAVRWASVTEVTVTYSMLTPPPGSGAITRTHMDSFSARPFIGPLAPDVSGVGRWQAWKLSWDAYRAAGPRLITAMIEAYESGRPAVFGPVRIDQHGVTSRTWDGVVSWADIRAIRMQQVVLFRGGPVTTEVRLHCPANGGNRKIMISGLPNGIFLPPVIAHAAAQHGVPVKGVPRRFMVGSPPRM